MTSFIGMYQVIMGFLEISEFTLQGCLHLLL